MVHFSSRDIARKLGSFGHDSDLKLHLKRRLNLVRMYLADLCEYKRKKQSFFTQEPSKRLL